MTDQQPSKRALHQFAADRVSASEQVRRYLAEKGEAGELVPTGAQDNAAAKESDKDDAEKK